MVGVEGAGIGDATIHGPGTDGIGDGSLEAPI